MTPVAMLGLLLAAAACVAGALLVLAHLVAWPEPAGRVIAGYLPRRWRPSVSAPLYSPADVTIRTRGIVLADLVVRGPHGEEVLVGARTPEEAAEIYRELTGEPWTRETAERLRDAAADRSAA